MLISAPLHFLKAKSKCLILLCIWIVNVPWEWPSNCPPPCNIQPYLSGLTGNCRIHTWSIVPGDSVSSDSSPIDLDINTVLPGWPSGEGHLDSAVTNRGGGLHHMGDGGVWGSVGHCALKLVGGLELVGRGVTAEQLEEEEKEGRGLEINYILFQNSSIFVSMHQPCDEIT